ncbi:hypothetical protein VNO80_09205 [Phaseolus coccineus]|uniref:Uncharacterized protein n=1 Tax=Phaseolus coccineus TaxID=3886 RepID=A0AAN9N7I9_PHACN
MHPKTMKRCPNPKGRSGSFIQGLSFRVLRLVQGHSGSFVQGVKVSSGSVRVVRSGSFVQGLSFMDFRSGSFIQGLSFRVLRLVNGRSGSFQGHTGCSGSFFQGLSFRVFLLGSFFQGLSFKVFLLGSFFQGDFHSRFFIQGVKVNSGSVVHGCSGSFRVF